MKKNYSKILTAFVAVALSGAAYAADTFTVDGLNYEVLNATTVIVKGPATAPTGDLVIPSTVTNGTTTYNVTAIEAQAFKDCSAITSVKLPVNMDSIGYQAFNGCSAMKSINLGDTKLKELQVSTFLSCKSLETVTIPATVTEVGTNPFMETLALKSINVAAGNPNYVDIDGVLFTADKKTLISYPVGKSTDYVVPEGTTEIAVMGFCQARTVRNVKFPSTLTTIGNQAFLRVDSLQLIEIPSSVTSIGSSAFAECKKAKGEIILPATLTRLMTKAFYYTQITKLDIPGSIKSIPDYVAQYCVKLTSLTLHEGTTTIGNYCFNTCAISEVVIPNTVTKIGTTCFEGSTNLKNVTIGEKVTSIGIRAFNGLNKIVSVKSLNPVPPTLGGTTTYPSFTATVCANAVLEVPAESIDAYKEATNWSAFTTIKAVESGVDGINADEVNITVTSEGLNVSGAENQVEVYSLSGVKIYSGQGGSITLPAKGMYIVRVDGKTVKVAF